MCQAMLENGAFDPALCPLLKNLTPSEIAEKLKLEPIRSCRERMAAVATGDMTADRDFCPALETDMGVA